MYGAQGKLIHCVKEQHFKCGSSSISPVFLLVFLQTLFSVVDGEVFSCIDFWNVLIMYNNNSTQPAYYGHFSLPIFSWIVDMDYLQAISLNVLRHSPLPCPVRTVHTVVMVYVSIFLCLPVTCKAISVHWANACSQSNSIPLLFFYMDLKRAAAIN